MPIWKTRPVLAGCGAGSRRQCPGSASGASPWPLSLPGVYAGAALVFIPALGIFAVPDLLGGTDGIMIGNLIKQQFLESRDWPFGSVLSIVLTLFRHRAGRAGGADWPAAHRHEVAMNKETFPWLAAALAYAFLYIPLIIVIVYLVQRSRV